MTYHLSILLIWFLIHYWDVFYQLLGSSWLCPSSCLLAESGISLKQISQGERCFSLGISVRLKYCCFHQPLRRSRKKPKSEYLLHVELFKNTCNLLSINFISMKSIVFVCQRAQGMLKELVCAGEGDVIPPSSMHGKLHWSALHYILGVS